MNAQRYGQPGEVLVQAQNVSKKFCRSLKRSLWYGVTDIASALNPFHRDLRTNDQRLGSTGLRKDEFFAVRDVSFEVRRGECLGLIGHNGAGKSTLLKMLNGLMPPDTGTITMRGRVAALIELNAGFNPILTGRENIYNEAALLGFTREETDAKFDAIVDFAEIGDFLDMPVQNYSSGMRVRLGFAVAAQMEPDILIIDEVLAVGDVAFRFKCLNRIGELMQSAAVIFVSHTMPQIFRLCDEVIVLNHGSASFQGRNIAEGVAAYLSLLDTSSASITGSGEIAVTNVVVKAGTNIGELGETVRAQYGGDLQLTARLKTGISLGSCRVQFLIWNAEMLPVMDVLNENLAGFEVTFDTSDTLDVTAQVRFSPLNGGLYNISVIVASLDYDRIYCRHDNAAYLQVDAPTTSGAHMLEVAEWHVSNLEHSVGAVVR
jgi:lipopolysaccharide transport system ATP-binding protein